MANKKFLAFAISVLLAGIGSISYGKTVKALDENSIDKTKQKLIYEATRKRDISNRRGNFKLGKRDTRAENLIFKSHCRLF